MISCNHGNISVFQCERFLELSVFGCDSRFLKKDMCNAVFKYNQIRNVRRHLSLCCFVNVTDLISANAIKVMLSDREVTPE